MSTMHTIPLDDLEARVAMNFTPYGYSSWTIVFDENASIIASTDSTLYFGYCLPELLTIEVSKALPDIDSEVIFAAVEDAGFTHDNCEEDE